ncbi:gamma-glutamylcyclotransferase [Marinomonas sp. 2405UD66-6]|uniref:gamma-glutamylcyclotransferase family protein n=1 Tax=Marinomonas sp. 2405UD66-6 TaxID=3391834 RepID=UPI0039C9AF54
MPTNIVAVYGTLREGLTNHKLIAGCKRIGLGWLTGFRMYNLGEYPGVIPTHDESGRIRVEWYDVPDDVLVELDRLEEFDPDALQTSLYLRKRVFSPYGQGWIYIYNQPLSSAPYMEAGDWERFTREDNEPKPANNTYKQEEMPHYGQAVPA